MLRAASHQDLSGAAIAGGRPAGAAGQAHPDGQSRPAGRVGGGPASWTYVALGSNLGDPAVRLRAAAMRLAALGEVTARSSLYLTAPVGGPSDQDDYLNAVIALAVDDADPHRLLERLLLIEQDLGRVRRERWGPRHIDLDLLAVGATVVEGGEEGGLVLPHPRLTQRPFVLVPWCEIASRRNETGPAWVHPLTGLDVCSMLAALAAGSELQASPVDAGVRRTDLTW